ncbi:MAG: cytochrome c oxidase subunit I [Actinomycetia bacterium]|nr:cytochrome c oxidase subunit I [Actinomycetes bacterium]
MATLEQAGHGSVEPVRSDRRAWLWDWLSVVDHKRIGQVYILAGLFFLAVGGVEAFLMRLQLFRPDNHLVGAEAFNELFTMHGTTMIFLAAMPLLTGFINVVVPLQIGARDVAFPRLNALSLWLFVAGALLLNSSWFLGGAPNAGWFNYAPISNVAYNPGHAIDFYDIGLQITGISSMLTAINFLVTIINLRAPGMTFMRLPMFVWTTIVTMILILFAFPPLTVNLFLQTFDRLFGAQFFNAATGGSPLLWANLFWIFGHPEVYIVVLPAFGMISEVVPVFSRKPLFGYASMVLATLAIGFLSFMVWVHHMFTLGYGPWINATFALSSMLIAVPTGVKVFNWLATMWGGRIRFTVAMHWVVAFLVCFVIGGMSGVMLAMAPADLQFNNSYFVVAHFHYTLIGGVVFGIFAGLYYWYPKITGRLLDERLGKWSFWLVFLGFNTTFFPMHFLGMLGMPRRIFTYGAGLGFTLWNQVATAGVFVMAAGVVLLLVNLAVSYRRGALAGADPWDGRTLEWAVSSPPPPYNFARLPLVRGYDAYWTEKIHGDGRLLPAPEPAAAHAPPGTVHMPSPTLVPAVLALAVLMAGYGLIFHWLWLDLVGFGLLAAALHRSMFTPDPGVYVPIAEEEAGTAVRTD